jgi:putative tryptophan/tyrosine transport system substrate-binding protein
VRRRAFIAVLGGAVAWPLAGRGQQPERVPRVGVLMPFSENDQNAREDVTAFAQALGRLGWVDGRNIQIDYRFAANDPALVKTYSSELVGLSPNAILASTPPMVEALRQNTHAIPIVFVLVQDPVGLGMVQSLSRPGGNITGFSGVGAPIVGKWLQLLKDIAPGVTRVAVIFNPDTQPYAKFFNSAIKDAASSFRVTIALVPVHDDAAVEEAIAAQAREPEGGLICLPDSFNETHRVAITAAAARHALPLIGLPDLVRAGGLISYWYESIDLYTQAASYIDRILKGASPADLPVQQPTKFSLIINLKTAKALGLTIPPTLLALADEVIE